MTCMLGCAKDWCLMCELEKHVTMLTESGGPLSPSRILSHMRRINCQIGDGSQEDAHEFLRSIITLCFFLYFFLGVTLLLREEWEVYASPFRFSNIIIAFMTFLV